MNHAGRTINVANVEWWLRTENPILLIKLVKTEIFVFDRFPTSGAPAASFARRLENYLYRFGNCGFKGR